LNADNTEKLVGKPKSLWYHSILIAAVIAISIFGVLCMSSCAFKIQLQEYTPEVLEEIRQQNIRSYRQGGYDAQQEYEAYMDEVLRELLEDQ
jgi:hypothetical protein